MSVRFPEPFDPAWKEDEPEARNGRLGSAAAGRIVSFPTGRVGSIGTTLQFPVIDGYPDGLHPIPGCVTSTPIGAVSEVRDGPTVSLTRNPENGNAKMHPLIERHRTEILALADRHGIRNVRVFGSMARGDAGDGSDVDLLVSLPPEKTGLALGALLMDVQELLNRRVEVLTEPGLHPAIRQRVLEEAQPL